MRIQLKIDHRSHQVLPINYQYNISSWIYKTLHCSDSDFALWLHEQGYEYKGKRYKHFCFSRLMPKVYRVDTQAKTFILEEGPSTLIISFNIDKAVKDMLKTLFDRNTIEITSGRSFDFSGLISQVKLLQPPSFQARMCYRTCSPICISVSDEQRRARYLSPLDEDYAVAFIQNTVNKANAYLGNEVYSLSDVGFHLLSDKVKPKLLKIKETLVKGYEFQFELIAPPSLQEIIYNAGFGTQNASLGLGFCEVIENK